MISQWLTGIVGLVSMVAVLVSEDSGPSIPSEFLMVRVPVLETGENLGAHGGKNR